MFFTLVPWLNATSEVGVTVNESEYMFENNISYSYISNSLYRAFYLFYQEEEKEEKRWAIAIEIWRRRHRHRR